MEITSRVLTKAAPLTALKVKGDRLYGNYHGFPVSVFDEVGALVFQVRLTSEAFQVLAAAPPDKARRESFGLRTSERNALALKFDPAHWTVVYRFVAVWTVKPEDVSRQLDGLVTYATTGGEPIGQMCNQCRTNPAKEVVLLGGVPTQLCEADLAKITQAAEERAEAVMRVPPGYLRALGGAVLGMPLGAFIWAGIGIATGRFFSLVAIAIGFLVAYFLSLGAKRITWGMVPTVAVMTLLAVFIGDLLWVAVLISQLGGPFDLGLAFQAYAGMSPGQSYVFGLFGAVVGSGWLIQQKTRSEGLVRVTR